MTDFKGESVQVVIGERGPKGDHGQHGEIGPQGPPGRAWSFRGLPVLRALAFIFVVVAAMVSVYYVNKNGIDGVQHAELASCVRTQYLRDQANGSSFLIYDTFKKAVDQQNEVIKSGKLQGAQLKQAKASVGRAQVVVDTTVVTGPTDCHQAVFNPDYKPPTPEFIATESARVKAARASAAKLIESAKRHS